MQDKSSVIVVEHMLHKDAFSQWLGIEILEVKDGYCKIKMMVRQEMMNGLNVVHGGIAFSFADSAFAFACNSRNNLSLAIECNISFLKQVNVGDVLIAEAKEVHNGKNTGVYSINIVNQHDKQIALFKGTCFRTGKQLI